MVSSPHSPAPGSLPDPPVPSSLDEFSLAGATPEDISQGQMFRLIKTIIPWEACQYHQVLPLSVEGKYLKLGMIDLDDAEALNYVRRTLGHIHCTVLPRLIDVDLLQHYLAAYQDQMQGEDSLDHSGPLRGTLFGPLVRGGTAMGSTVNRSSSSRSSSPASSGMTAKTPGDGEGDRAGQGAAGCDSIREASTRETSTREAGTREASTREASTREASTHEASTHEASAQDSKAQTRNITTGGAGSENTALNGGQKQESGPRAKSEPRDPATDRGWARPSGFVFNPNLSPTANAALGARIRAKLGQSRRPEPIQPSPPSPDSPSQDPLRQSPPLQSPPLQSPPLQNSPSPDSPSPGSQAASANPTTAPDLADDSRLSPSSGNSHDPNPRKPIAAASARPGTPTTVFSIPEPNLPIAPNSPPPPPPPAHLPHADSPIPPLNLHTYYLTQPLDVLADLPPHNVLQELLGRALLGGIGRLYFEPAGSFGRILWSQSGVLQSVLDPVDWLLYCGVIEELKQLAGLPPQPLTQAQQVDLERMHQDKRLLLRIRITPQAKGEQATLQVLRGAALKFYEQQQISKLEKDALQIAQQLNRKLTELRSSHTAWQDDRGPSEESLVAIAELKEMLNTINQRIQNL